MKTLSATSWASFGLTVLTALVINQATLAEPPKSAGTAATGPVPNYLPPRIVVDLVIKDSADHVGRDSDCTAFPARNPASFAPGSLTITTSHSDVIYGDLNWSIPSNLRVWWKQGCTWELVSSRAGYPTGATETLCVEGMAPGSGPIVVTFTPETEPATPGEGKVKVTVGKHDLVRDANKDNQARKDQVKVNQLCRRQIIEQLDGRESSATVLEVIFEPGQKGTPHSHAGPVFGYVLEGEYEHAINDEPIKSYKAGDTFYEPTGSVHRVAQNPSSKTRTRLLAVILHPREVKDPTIREQREP